MLAAYAGGNPKVTLPAAAAAEGRLPGVNARAALVSPDRLGGALRNLHAAALVRWDVILPELRACAFPPRHITADRRTIATELPLEAAARSIRAELRVRVAACLEASVCSAAVPIAPVEITPSSRPRRSVGRRLRRSIRKI